MSDDNDAPLTPDELEAKLRREMTSAVSTQEKLISYYKNKAKELKLKLSEKTKQLEATSREVNSEKSRIQLQNDNVMSTLLENAATKFPCKYEKNTEHQAQKNFFAGNVDLINCFTHLNNPTDVKRVPVTSSVDPTKFRRFEDYAQCFESPTILWWPLKQYKKEVEQIARHYNCKGCQEKGYTKQPAFTTGKIGSPVQGYDVGGTPCLLVSPELKCKHCQKVLSDDEFWKIETAQEVLGPMYPVLRTRNSFVTIELIEQACMAAASRSSVSEFRDQLEASAASHVARRQARVLRAFFNAHEVMVEGLHKSSANTATLNSMCEQLDDVLSHLKSSAASVCIPSARVLRKLVIQHVRNQKDGILNLMHNFDLGFGTTLSADHTFKTASQILDKSLSGLFTVWNGDGIPIMQFFCEDLTLDTLQKPLTELASRINWLTCYIQRSHQDQHRDWG